MTIGQNDSEIAKQLGKSVETCKRKWRNLIKQKIVTEYNKPKKTDKFGKYWTEEEIQKLIEMKAQ